MAERNIATEVHELSKEVARDVILLIYGNLSGDAKLIANQLIRHILSHVNLTKCRVAMVQYGKKKSDIEHNFSQDRFSLQNKANSLSNMTSWGGSSLALGMQTCWDLFTTQRSNAERVVFLIAPGITGDDLKDTALRLRERLFVKIIGVGVGPDVRREELERVASLQHVHVIPTMTDLRNLFIDIGAGVFQKPVVKVVRRFCTSLELEINCPEEISQYKVELFDETVNTPDKYRFLYDISVPNPVAATVLARIAELIPSQKVSVRVSGLLAYNRRQTEAVILEDKTLDERQDPAVLKNPAELVQKISEMVRDIRTWVPDPYLAERISLNLAKIALLARVGEGKSSLTNTIDSIFFGQYRVVALAMSHFRTVTSKLTEYPLSGTRVILMDTFGWEDEGQNYTDQEQQLICDGVIGDGFKEGTPITGDMATNAAFNRAVHAVIIICDADAVTNENYMARIKNFELNWKTKFGRSVVVAMTKCDVADPHLVEHPEDIYNSNIIKTRIATLIEKTGIDRGDIYPCINRTSFNAVNPAVCEYLALKVLHASLFTCVNGLFANEVRRLKLQELRAPPAVRPDPVQPVNVAEPVMPHNVPPPMANAESLVLLTPLPDGSLTEVVLRERTIRELKAEIVAIEELHLHSVDDITRVFTHKEVNGRVEEVTLRNDDAVRRLSPDQKVYFRIQ